MSNRGSRLTAGLPSYVDGPFSSNVGSIIRVSHQVGRWEAIPRALIEDQNLSFLARWFAIWLAARPPGWEIRAGLLPQLLKDHTRRSGHLGRDSTKRLLRELQNAGYLIRSKYRDTNGRWVWKSCFSATKNVASTADWQSVDGGSVAGKSGDLSDTEVAPTQIDSKRTTTAVESEIRHSSARAVGVGLEADLQFPDVLAGVLMDSARKLINRCPVTRRQAVLNTAS